MPNSEERSPFVDLFAAMYTFAYQLAAVLGAHTYYIHALYQPDYHTPYLTAVVGACVEKHEKRELPVVSPRYRRGNTANGRNRHQWPWQDLSTRFERPPASLLLVAVGGIGPPGRHTKPRFDSACSYQSYTKVHSVLHSYLHMCMMKWTRLTMWVGGISKPLFEDETPH